MWGECMPEKIIQNQAIVQICLVVKDVAKSAANYAEFFHLPVPEYIVTDGYEKTQAEVHGKPTDTRVKIATFKFGQIVLELLEPDDQPSTWKETLDENGEGLHHIAFFVKGMRHKIQLMQEAGFPLLQKGEFEGGRYAYFDTREKLKLILEFLEDDQAE